MGYWTVVALIAGILIGAMVVIVVTVLAVDYHEFRKYNGRGEKYELKKWNKGAPDYPPEWNDTDDLNKTW